VTLKRPKFHSDESNQFDHNNVDLLKTHLKNSTRNQHSTNEFNLPSFSLPIGLGVKGGDNDSYAALCAAIDDFVHITSPTTNNSDELKTIPMRAFSLISALYVGRASEASETVRTKRGAKRRVLLLLFVASLFIVRSACHYRSYS